MDRIWTIDELICFMWSVEYNEGMSGRSKVDAIVKILKDAQSQEESDKI